MNTNYYMLTQKNGCIHYFFIHYNTNDFTKEEFEKFIKLYFKKHFQLQKSNKKLEQSKDITKFLSPSLIAENKEKINKQTLNKLIDLWDKDEKFIKFFAYDIKTIKNYVKK